MTDKPDSTALDRCHGVFRGWLGQDYDLDVLDVVLAVAAGEKLEGDPAWLLVVSGSGAAKTETIAPLAGAGALVTSTIASEGALLSGTASKERSKSATGGLLRKIGDAGVLVIKDVTSILSMNRDTRGLVLSALREVYDRLVAGGRRCVVASLPPTSASAAIVITYPSGWRAFAVDGAQLVPPEPLEQGRRPDLTCRAVRGKGRFHSVFDGASSASAASGCPALFGHGAARGTRRDCHTSWQR